MKLSNISSYWSTDLIKYLRPTHLISGVIAGCRLAWDALSGVDKLGEAAVPVGIGSLYTVLSVPLDNIKRNGAVAGIGEVFSDFPYIVVGLPSGILYFSKSAVSVGASLYHDYIEYSGIYYFKENPVDFGTVNTKGSLSCEFVAAVADTRTLEYQDINKRYKNSTAYTDNRVIEDSDINSQAVGGISNRLPLLQAGNSVAESAVEIERYWVEGGKLYAYSKNGQLLCDSYKQDMAGTVKALPAGVSLSDNIINDFALYPGPDGFVYYIPKTDNVVLDAFPGLRNYLPGMEQINAVPYGRVVEALRSAGFVTMDSSNGRRSVQQAVSSRISPVSNLFLAKKIDIKTTSEWLDYSDSDSSDYGITHCYVYIGRKAAADSPEIFNGITPREAIRNYTDKYTILRIKLQNTEDGLTAVTDNAEVFGKPLNCGTYVNYVALVSGGSKYTDDVILKGTQLRVPEMVYAGKCLVLNISIGSDNV